MSLLLTPEEAAAELRVGRSRVYQLMATGEINSFRIGKSRRIPREALTEFVARMQAAAPQPAQPVDAA